MTALFEASAGRRARLLDWLLDACRFWLTADPDDAPRDDPDDWKALAGFAYFHDLEPLLHHLAGVGRLDLGARLPAAVERQWESAYYRNFVFNVELLDLLETLLAAAERDGIEIRVYKGPVTLARGWLDPALRVMADVDLICRSADLPRLADIARGLDFETGPQSAAHHLALVHGTLPAALELHFRLYEVFARPNALLERLWSEPARVEVDGRQLPAPSPELAAVLDLGHLLQHDLELNLKPFLDLAATLWRQHHALDEGLLLELLAEADLEPECRTLVGLLDRVLGLPVAATGPAPREPPSALISRLHTRLCHPETLDRVGALAGPHRQAGGAATAAYVWRRLVPPLDQLQAMTGAHSRARALLGYPRHVAATVARATRRWRQSGPGRGGASLKAELFRRRSD